MKNVPKKNGSGLGVGANAGRGGCENPKGTRQGMNRRETTYDRMVRNLNGGIKK